MIAEFRARMSDKLRVAWPDLVIVAALLALFGLVHRFVECVEIGGDAISKWHFVRQWFYGNEFGDAKWDHHHARMGVNALTWLVQAIFGRNWRAYYVGPFFMAAIQLPLVYLLGKRLSGRGVGILAALFVTFLTAVHRSASQLLPDGFAGTYAVMAAYAFARFVEAEHARTRLRWLVALSVLAFVGYLTKETFFFFFPAFVVGVWLTRRSVRDVGVFCGSLLLGLALETAAYRIFTTYGSRLAIVRGTHLKDGGADEPAATLTWAGFVDPLVKLERDWQVLLSVALLGAIFLLAFNRRAVVLGRTLALLALCHVGFLTVSTQLFQGPRPRYMDPVTPFAALCAAALIGALVSRAAALGPVAKLSHSSWFARFGPSSRPSATAMWALGVLVIVAALVFRQQQQQPPFDGWAQGARMAKLANRTYDRNLPIAAPQRGAKTLMTLYAVYMDDKRLARDGKLPNYPQVRQRYKTLAYIVKDPGAYRRDTFRRLLDAGCVVQLRRGSRGKGTRGYVDTTLTGELPPECDTLLAKATRRR